MSYTPFYPSKPSHPDKLAQRPLLIDIHNLAHPAIPVTPLIYGGFIEHLGRCIYGGIVDNPEDPSPKAILTEEGEGRLGFRKDVIGILKDEMEVPLMRWPGGEFDVHQSYLSSIVYRPSLGNFASNYHWQDGIGPISERPARIELAWGAADSNMYV
jgi:alpha-N-arabinofuranosidase